MGMGRSWELGVKVPGEQMSKVISPQYPMMCLLKGKSEHISSLL